MFARRVSRRYREPARGKSAFALDDDIRAMPMPMCTVGAGRLRRTLRGGRSSGC